ncbi:MAG TPA: DUF167 domain-containing protein [Streptosporangiaceae bacterium]|jgi:uncharacterized protein YggU (UPF0235/DUF167 family)|nr:DUF167 domain-containing protein [Streptosporangiaceae bacterium]
MRVAIRVRPGAARTRVGGTYGGDAASGGGGGAAGGAALVVKVAARAVDGKATEAALAAVAAALGVRRGDIRLVSGATSRDKVVEVDGDVAQLTRRIDELRGS